MKRSLLWVRLGGIAVLVTGALLVLFAFTRPVEVGNETERYELILRAGFGILLVGMFAVFLFSETTFPRELALSIPRTQDENNVRLLTSLNLKGKGVYMPPGGRLITDRVFVPVEERDLPLPTPSDHSVVNTGDLGPALGMFFIPPGKDAVDQVESMTGRRFSDDDPDDAEQAMERLSKGAGAFKEIRIKRQGQNISLSICHSTMDPVCDGSFKTSERLHAALGCTACSMPLTALSRIEGAPLAIRSVSRTGKEVKYELRRMG